MEEILKQLTDGKKFHLTAFVAFGVFLGIQYSQFKSRLDSIESRIAVMEENTVHLWPHQDAYYHTNAVQKFTHRE